MPRYVILKHETAGGVHFDFMLEMGGVLKTWSLPQPPVQGIEIDAEALPDHRSAYLDYEGPISDDRGSVTRWDWGTYEMECNSDSKLTVRLCGEKHKGRACLRRLSNVRNLWHFRIE
jgi:DNA polymerase Ligase (LigD)